MRVKLSPFVSVYSYRILVHGLSPLSCQASITRPRPDRHGHNCNPEGFSRHLSSSHWCPCLVHCLYVCPHPSIDSGQALVPLLSRGKGGASAMPGNGFRFQRGGLILLWQEKEPRSHFYMCWAEHRENYRNCLMHTLYHPPYIGLEVLYLILALTIKAALIKTIIPLSKKLSIVFGF